MSINKTIHYENEGASTPDYYDVGKISEFLKAWSTNDVPGVLLALKNGANPNATLDGDPLLLVAAERGDEGLVKALLQSGARVNARSVIDGRTALHRAVGYPYRSDMHLRVIRLLVSYGADLEAYTPNANGRKGVTILESAIGSGNIAAADLLVDLGAHRSPSFTSRGRSTPEGRSQ